MRIRTIKPEFFLHDGLYEAETETKLPLRIAFIGLWCAADRSGRFKWEPRRLGVSILPYDGTDFSRVLDALVTRGFVVKYASSGEVIGWIPSFERHQVINNRESASCLPAFTEGEGFTLGDDALPTRGPRVPHASKGEGKGREGKGKELGESALPSASSPKKDEPTDEEWLRSLSSDPAYNGISVSTEYAKMARWCEVNRKSPSRRRFINWINRIEKPLGAPRTFNEPVLKFV
jgi:hypothetical protein